MRPSWDRLDLENAYLSRQRFSPEQVGRLRADVVARTGAQVTIAGAAFSQSTRGDGPDHRFQVLED
jgi:hypothetical protein